jgi:tetratricopeptide (TPR) repeat protein
MIARRLSLMACLMTLAVAKADDAAPTPDSGWRKLTANHFTVYSQVDDQATRAWANQFNQFIAAVHRLVKVNEALLPPLTVVLFKGDYYYAPYAPLLRNGEKLPAPGFFHSDSSWAATAVQQQVDAQDTRRLLLEDGVYWYLTANPHRRPLAITHGLATLFSTFEIQDGHAAFGLPRNDMLTYLRLPNTKLLPVVQLLGTRTLDPVVAHHDYGLFDMESWALVHYLYFGKPYAGSPAFNTLMAAFAGGRQPAEALQEALGNDARFITTHLQFYIRDGPYQNAVFPLDQTANVTAPFQDPAPAEVELALARVAIGEHPPLARTHAENAIRLAPSDPGGYEMLALISAVMTGAPESVAMAQKATELGSKDGMTWYLLGEGKARRVLAEHRFTPAAGREAVNGFEKAILVQPNLERAYVGLANWIGAADHLREDDGKFLAFGVEMFPEQARLRLGEAIFQRRQGDLAAAKQALAIGKQLAQDQGSSDLALIRALEEESAREAAPPAAEGLSGPGPALATSPPPPAGPAASAAPTAPATPAAPAAPAALAENPSDDFLAVWGRAKANLDRHSYASAIADCTRVLQLKPDFTLAYHLRGVCQDHLGNYAMAISDLDAAIKRDGQNPWSFGFRGAAKEAQGDFAGALSDYEQCIALNPSGGRHTMIWCYFMRRLLHRGHPEADLSAAIAPWYGSWVKHVALYVLGRESEPDLLTLANQGEPNVSRGQRCEAYFYIGMTDLINQDAGAARVAFQRCLDERLPGLLETILAQAELSRLTAP